ncbi:MAG: phosphoadenosine phosphosulfate reductase family protein [Cyanobacteria bacterium J06638_22]
MRNLSLFEDQRLTLEKAIALTEESLNHYGAQYKHWAIAFSGGKDSTATLTIILHLLAQGRIPQPETLTVLYADTRQELPPLHQAAMASLKYARSLGCDVRIVLPEMDRRFWVYILGRGVPSPNNGTLRWCTRQIKVDPMIHALADVREQMRDGDRLLMLTGVRIGESAARDQRIAVSCSKDGGECGQGWFQAMTAPQTDTLAPILHWRLCHVWDWLMLGAIEHGFPTADVAIAYGQKVGVGEEPIDGRTGCVGCPLVSDGTEDTLIRLVKQPQFAYLAPLQKIRPLHREIRKFKHRLQKTGLETKKDGTPVKNPGRKGPLTLQARIQFLEELLAIQREVNTEAKTNGHAPVWLVTPREEARIRELIDLRTFPDKWTGDEIAGDRLTDHWFSDGSVQPVLFDLEEVV